MPDLPARPDDESLPEDPGSPSEGPDLGALLGEGSGGLEGLLAQAAAMTEQLAAAQEAAAAVEMEGTAGAGRVSVTVTGAGEFRRVRIDPAVVDPDDVEMLEDLVLAALHDAMARVGEAQAANLGPLGSVDLGDLGGLLGGRD